MERPRDIPDRISLRVRPPFLRQFRQSRCIQRRGVGEDREDDRLRAELKIPRRLYGSQEIPDTGYAEEREHPPDVLRDAKRTEASLSLGIIEEPEDPHAVLVVDGSDRIGVHDIVHPGDVLVADPLDPVSAEAVHEERRALESFARDCPAGREPLFQIVPGGNRAGGSCRRDERRRLPSGKPEIFEHLLDRRSRHIVMEYRIAEFLKLVKYDVQRILLQLPALIVYLLDVRLASRRGNHLRTDLPQPCEPFPGHLLRKYGHRCAPEESAVERSAPAEISRGRPDGPVAPGIKFAADQPGDKASERRSHFMRPGGEELPRKPYDPRPDTGDLAGYLEGIDFAVEAGGDIILPRDAE